MFEIYGSSEANFASNTMNFNVGFDIELNPKLHRLMSAGSGLWAPQGEEALDYDFS